ncbi:protein of unknown function, might belong to Phosphotyrosine protein phosphatase [Shewanella benthica]|uniref:Uncharacterized protein n=1 Tax=Shewanella benthica TaxID=43661 RepID=A0A330MBU0_9GAMM|nr:hypothetical protein [Shewanella benthica]SQH77277.1 protein of unknown function, might belong to Phosphotyrosine protein phosphatase [Shewanella benthica]
MNVKNEVGLTLKTYENTELSEQELVQLQCLGDRDYKVIRIPAKLFGFTYGDIIEDCLTHFELKKRSGYIGCRVYGSKMISESRIEKINNSVKEQGGVYEEFVNNEQQFLYLVALPARIGWRNIQIFCDENFEECSWEYTNVYDPNGNFLEWWKGKGVALKLTKPNIN